MTALPSSWWLLLRDHRDKSSPVTETVYMCQLIDRREWWPRTGRLCYCTIPAGCPCQTDSGGASNSLTRTRNNSN
jgi:hypothetical protein